MVDISMLADRPELLAALVLVLRFVLAYQRSLSWQEYRTIHALKRTVVGLSPRDSIAGVSLVNEKGYHDDGEYLVTVEGSVRGVARRLVDGDGSLHLINSLKRRETPVGVQYSAAHVVWTHADGQQTEAYLFPAVDGDGVDVYAHSEASVTDPLSHLDGPQPDGDPRGVVRDALGLPTETDA